MTAEAAVRVTLPRGTWRRGRHHRTAALRPLTGHDEAFLLEDGPLMLPAERDTAILDRCMDGRGRAADLSAGDRTALLLQLFRISFGELAEVVVECPSCGESLEADMPVGALVVDPDPAAEPVEWHSIAVQWGTEGRVERVRFRPPTGGELEEAARMVRGGDASRAAGWLLDSCVTEGTAGRAAAAREAIRRAVLDALPEVEPQAEVALDLTCPACGTRFASVIDPGDFLSRYVHARGASLYREVLHLAATHRWREEEILAMPARRRRRYVEVGGWGDT